MAIKLFANYEHGKVGIMDTPRGLWDLPRCACLFPSRSPRGFAALRAPHPFPLAAGALAKLWEIKELRGRGRYSVYVQCLTKASF